MDRKSPAERPQVFEVKPLRVLEESPRPAGRPKKRKLAPVEYAFNEVEWERYYFFIDAAHELLGKSVDMLDEMFIELAASEYVSYLRIKQLEIEKHTSITMARQHPGVQMRALIDMLSISRKARQTNKQEKDPDREEALKVLKSLAG